MAKDPKPKKEEEDKDKEPELNYTEDIQGKDMDTVATDVPVEEEKEEEKPKEEPKEPTEKKEEVKEPEESRDEEKFDAEKFKAEVKEEVAKETADKVVQSLKGEDATEKEVDEYTRFAQETFEKEGRNPTYPEAFKFLSQQLKDEIKRDQEAAQKTEEEKREELRKWNEEEEKRFNAEIDEQLNDLYNLGRLPKIEDPKDTNDTGRQARIKLFQTMREVNVERVNKGLKPIRSIKEIYYEHYKAPNRQPAGHDAPVSAGRGGTPSGEEKEINYKRDILGKRFEDM